MKYITLVTAVALLTAGCVAGLGELAGAEQGLEQATEIAEDRLEAPTLVEVWGAEPPHRLAGEGHDIVIHADDRPGDGRAPGWSYTFLSPEAELTVVIVPGLGVLAEVQENRTVEAEEIAQRALGNWTVDAPEAAEALSAHEDWPGVQDDLSVLWTLTSENGTAIWMVIAHEGEPFVGEAVVQAAVDARTGEVLFIERGPSWSNWGQDAGYAYDGSYNETYYGGAHGGCEQDDDRGPITPADGLQAEVRMPAPGELHITAELEGPSTGSVLVTLARDGMDIWTEVVEGDGLTSGATLEGTVEDQPAGTYTLTATAGDATTVMRGVLELEARWGAPIGADVDTDWGPPSPTNALPAPPAWLLSTLSEPHAAQ
ncbi:MAG: hypothetical protein R3185_01110 [Candidatus Thermoplasmatota archaeon]|nr:hypothetical protein [Candidatus Thermoplasmatota archaeon]